MTFLTSLQLGKYYGLDWIAVIAMVCSMYTLARQNRYGFVFGGISNLCWIAFGMIVWSVADASANILLFGLNVWGFWNWSVHSAWITSTGVFLHFPSPREIGFVNFNR